MEVLIGQGFRGIFKKITIKIRQLQKKLGRRFLPSKGNIL